MRTATHKPKFFTMRCVPHAEFQALQRFPEYTLLQDGILQHIEPDGFEFRVFDEEKEPFHYGPMTTAFMRELQEYIRWQNANSGQAFNSDAAPLDISVTPVADERSP